MSTSLCPGCDSVQSPKGEILQLLNLFAITKPSISSPELLPLYFLETIARKLGMRSDENQTCSSLIPFVHHFTVVPTVHRGEVTAELLKDITKKGLSRSVEVIMIRGRVFV